MKKNKTSQIWKECMSLEPYRIEIGLQKGESFTLNIHEDIDFATLMSISNKVTEACINPAGYHPELKVPLLLFYVLDYMSNLDAPKDQDDYIDMEELFILYRSGVGQTIIESWDMIPTVRMLLEMVDKKIEFEKEQLKFDHRAVELVNRFASLADHQEETSHKMEKEFQELLDDISKNFQEYIDQLDEDKQIAAAKEMLEIVKEMPVENRSMLNYLSKTETGKTLEEHLEQNEKTDALLSI